MGPLCTGATGHGNAPYAGPRMTYPSADIGNASTPVAIFAFARPDHLRRTIQSLQANAEAALTHVTVYCDGPRNQFDIPQVESSEEHTSELQPLMRNSYAVCCLNK